MIGLDDILLVVGSYFMLYGSLYNFYKKLYYDEYEKDENYIIISAEIVSDDSDIPLRKSIKKNPLIHSTSQPPNQT